MPTPNEIYDIAVIGAGAAGQMALLRAVLNQLKTVVFLGEAGTQRKARSTWIPQIENIPGFFGRKHPVLKMTQETIQFIQSRPELSKYLTVVKAAAAQAQKENGIFYFSAGGSSFAARFAVLCTGVTDVQPRIAGSIEPVFPYANRDEICYCVRCSGHKTIGKNTAVIGSNDGAAHMAVLLYERYHPTSLSVLTNGNPWTGSEESTRLLKQYGISIEEGPIEKILGDPREGLEGFWAGGRRIPAEIAFVALGVIVYHDLAKQLGARLDERGHVLTDDEGLTSIEGFYAAGDIVSGRKKQIYSAWDGAVDAVDSIDYEIRMLKRNGRYQE